MFKSEARALKVSAVELHILHLRTGATGATRFSVERDEIVADLLAEGEHFNPTTYVHPQDVD
jgi:hypothetical protein